MAQLASSSSTSISRYPYDAFLSFRGEDTRLGFTGHLYSALSRRGIFTFIDDALRRGEEITPSLCKAIQESRIAIIIFSKDYASSTFCLDELVHILECCTKQNRGILPVFYDIDPSHVRCQTESYQKAFAKHQSGRFKDNVEKVQKWRSALRQAADLAGWHFKIGKESESEFIEKITKVVSNELDRRPLRIADYPVGLKARTERIQQLMGAESDKKVMLGIHGMGGLGKSTLARAIYNLKAHQFEGSCFLANVRENSSTKQGLVQIQETMLSELVGERDVKLGDVNQGIPLLQHRLCRKKVLLVVDDIDKKEQLQATAGGLDWFGPGSIVIITTRDKHLLDIHGVEIEKQCTVDQFNDIEALDLLRWNAFKNKEVGPGYEEIMKRAIYCASKLPLALEIIGSDLFGKTLDECDSALKAYESIPNRNVLDMLRVSYDSLQDNEQKIFSDIACFFRGCPLEDVANILEARCFHPKFGIGVLEKKSLIKIDRDNGETVMMHDLIQSMGREIVRQRSTRPHNRNRLYIYEDIACVLEKNEDNDNIEALMLDPPEDQKVQWNPQVFGKMKNLQMLLIKKNVGFLGRINLPNSLRVLEWRGYPKTSLPSTFRPNNLSILNLSYSDFKWNEDKALQNSNLRHLILRGCKKIRRIPNISTSLSNLTKLCVCECTNLIEIDESVGHLNNLQRFCAEGCSKLKIGPRGIKLKSLEYLSLRDCSSLTMFPEILAPMPKLKFVDLGGTDIKNLPLSMQNLEGLQTLCMERCKILECSAPSNFFQKLAELFPNLTKLNLQGSTLRTLPACIKECRSLRSINVSNCKELQEIGALPPGIIEFSAHNTAVGAEYSTLNMLLQQAIGSTAISYYGLPGQRIPQWFDHSTNGNTLFFWFRNKLPNFTVCALIGVGHKIKRPCRMEFHFIARINNIDMCVSCSIGSGVICISDYDHLYMFNIQNDFHKQKDSEIERTLKTNEWIHGNVSFVMASGEDSGSLGIIKGIGVHVNDESRRMKNVRFTDPNAPNKILEQKQSLTLFNPGNREKIQAPVVPYTIPLYMGDVSASSSGGLDYESGYDCNCSRITPRPQMNCSKQLPEPDAERGKQLPQPDAKRGKQLPQPDAALGYALGMSPSKRKPRKDR